MTTSTTELDLPDQPRTASANDSAAVHVRARLDEQVRELLAHQEGARVGDDPEHVHQLRVAVRRARAALKAEGGSVENADTLQTELKWLGSSLGAVRDLDVQLGHLRSQTADFDESEQAAVDTLLHGLELDRRVARRKLLGTLRTKRYQSLLRLLADAAASEAPEVDVAEAAPSLIDVVRKPYKKLMKAADALGEDPPDDDLHELRIYGKRLRYSAELVVPGAGKAGKAVKAVIKATKEFQDLLGDHQDAVLAEQEVRRLLAELAESPDGVGVDVVFVAGRLVERERNRRADRRARWRESLAEVDERVRAVLNG